MTDTDTEIKHVKIDARGSDSYMFNFFKVVLPTDMVPLEIINLNLNVDCFGVFFFRFDNFFWHFNGQLICFSLSCEAKTPEIFILMKAGQRQLFFPYINCSCNYFCSLFTGCYDRW